jgi:ligand-binding sensor domain-containing protein
MSAVGHRPRRSWHRLCRMLVRASMASVLCFMLQNEAQASADPWLEMADSLFVQLGEQEGTADVVATTIAQDGQGYLWEGTQNGLARWDGYRFRI